MEETLLRRKEIHRTVGRRSGQNAEGFREYPQKGFGEDGTETR